MTGEWRFCVFVTHNKSERRSGEATQNEVLLESQAKNGKGEDEEGEKLRG
jgi:hypothetical protein